MKPIFCPAFKVAMVRKLLGLHETVGAPEPQQLPTYGPIFMELKGTRSCTTPIPKQGRIGLMKPYLDLVLKWGWHRRGYLISL